MINFGDLYWKEKKLVALKQMLAYQIYTTATNQFPLTLYAPLNSINCYANTIHNCVMVYLLLRGTD